MLVRRALPHAADRFADATRPGLAMARQNETRFDMLEARERRYRLRKVGAEWRELRTPLPSKHVHRAQGVPDEQGVPRGNVEHGAARAMTRDVDHARRPGNVEGGTVAERGDFGDRRRSEHSVGERVHDETEEPE